MNTGMIDLPSPYSVPDTLARLESILKQRGVSVFACVDHSGEGRSHDAPHAVAHLRKSQGWNPFDGGGPEHRDRSPAEGAGLGR